MSDPRELLDRLDQARAAATPGVWKLWGMTVMSDQDGTSNVDTAATVARTSSCDENGRPRTVDASLICDMHRALPQLTAAIRAVLDLAGSLDVDSCDPMPDERAGLLFEIAERIRAAVQSALATDPTSQEGGNQ